MNRRGALGAVSLVLEASSARSRHSSRSHQRSISSGRLMGWSSTGPQPAVHTSPFEPRGHTPPRHLGGPPALGSATPHVYRASRLPSWALRTHGRSARARRGRRHPIFVLSSRIASTSELSGMTDARTGIVVVDVWWWLPAMCVAKWKSMCVLQVGIPFTFHSIRTV